MASSDPCRAREPSEAKSSRGCDGSQEDLDAGRFFQDLVPLVFVAGVAFDGHVGLFLRSVMNVCIVSPVALCKLCSKFRKGSVYKINENENVAIL